MFDSVWYNDVLYTFLVLGIFGLELLPKPKHYYISLDEDLVYTILWFLLFF